jgi:hypothetical protein
MKTKQLNGLLAISLVAALAGPALCVGPTSTLYVTNYLELGGGTITGLDLIQGPTAISYPTSYPLGIDIAVYGDVRTMGYSAGDKGERFDLAANPLIGGPYTNNIANSQLHDGTSDGNYNYSVNYTTGDVIRFDRNWANPLVLFNATANISGAGWITMNATDGSFWISQWGGPDLVAHFTSAGSLLGTFNSGVLGSAGLALDPVDGTLWMGDSTLTLHQFSQSGVALQSVAYAVQGSWYGMEFDTNSVPEPSGLALAPVALLGIFAWRCCRRKKRIEMKIQEVRLPRDMGSGD